MNKFVNSIILGLFVFTILTVITSSCSTTKNVQMIELDDKFGQFGTGQIDPFIKIVSKHNQCTAIVIDNNYAATASHCLTDANQKLRTTEYDIYTSENALHSTKATPAGVNLNRDLGLLKGDFKAFKSMEADFHKWRIKPNHLYFTCGFANGDIHMTCTPFQPISNHFFFVQGMGFLYPGMSGGIVIDGDVGDVVGINVAVGDGMVYVSPLIGYLGIFGLEGE